MPLPASEFLNRAAGHLLDRAVTYDAPSGERSMEKTILMLNTLISEKLREPLDEVDGWHFMEILKMVRSHQGDFKADNFEDGAAYAALAGEAALKMVEKR